MTMLNTSNVKNGRSLKIASISDIHLGHRRTKAQFIIDNLNKYFSTNEILSQIDILFFAGDVFDSLLSYDSEDISLIEVWIAKLFRKCFRHEVTVVVLKGTNSHDRNQNQAFVKIHSILEKHNHAPTLHYADKLSIIHIEKYDINVLCVPDEWRNDCNVTFSEVTELLNSKGLQKVDFAIMHGMFTYQCPEISKPHLKHLESNYLPIVRYLIFIGHVHTHSTFDRIFSQGSFDRLAQDEEEPKGFLLAEIVSDTDYKVTFIENKSAKIYKTLQCKHEDALLAMEYIASKIKSIPNDSYIRIIVNKSSALALSEDVLNKRWPTLNWKIDYVKKKNEQATIDLVVNSAPRDLIVINKDSVTDLVKNKLKEDGIIEDDILLCLEALTEHL